MIDANAYPSRGPQIAGLITKEAPTKVLVEYANFADVFSLDLSGLPEHTEINKHAIKLVNVNGFIQPSKSSIGAPRQAEKGLILPEEFLLADASMVFHLQQCKHTVCIRETYSATDNQAGKTLEWRPKGQFVAWSWRSKMSPSQSPPSIRITLIFSLQNLQRHYPSTPTWPSKSSVGAPRLSIYNDDSLWLCIWGLNNLTMKNGYPLPMIKALPFWSKCQFRQERVNFRGYDRSSHVALTFKCSSDFYQQFI